MLWLYSPSRTPMDLNQMLTRTTQLSCIWHWKKLIQIQNSFFPLKPVNDLLKQDCKSISGKVSIILFISRWQFHPLWFQGWSNVAFIFLTNQVLTTMYCRHNKANWQYPGTEITKHRQDVEFTSLSHVALSLNPLIMKPQKRHCHEGSTEFKYILHLCLSVD